MRFGRSLHEFRIPDFEDVYLDYNYYKRRIKIELVHQQTHDIDADAQNALLSDFISGLTNVENIYICKLGNLHSAIVLSSQYGGFETVEGVLGSDLQHLQPELVQMLYEQFGQLLDSAQQLIWYGYVHKKAIEKLYAKLRRSGYDITNYRATVVSTLESLDQRECLQLRQELAKVIAHLSRRVVADPSTSHGSKWYLVSSSEDLRREFGPYALGCAAKYGLLDICKELLDFSEVRASWEQFKPPIDVVWTSPLKLGVIHGHSEIVESILLGLGERSSGTSHPRLNNLLLLAARFKFDHIVSLLISHGANVNFSETNGETVLYIAARSGETDLVESLLEDCPSLNINVKERSRHWTPLLAACVYGHVEVVQLLIRHGADQHARDVYGWTIKDHVAFRGNLHIMRLFTGPEEDIPFCPTGPMNSQRNETTRPVTQNSMGDTESPNDPSRGERSNSGPLSHILVAMGGANLRSSSLFVDLSHEKFRTTSHVPTECGLALKVSAINATGPNPTIPVPVLDDQLNYPWVFTTENPENVKFMFDLVQLHSYSDNSGDQIASAVAMVDVLTKRVADGRESLVRDHCVALVNTKSEYVGSVTFHTLVVKPCNGSTSSPPPAINGFWKDNGPIQVVGHRGSGANSSDKGNLQLGENTLQSFNTAIALGASSVEFDVQLTRDFQTAIFHDFLVKETGGDIPIHSLTRDQFMLLGTTQSPRGFPSGMAETRYLEKSQLDNDQSTRPRSLSLNNYEDSRVQDLHTRMKHTIEGRHEIKGNIRGSAIQEPFTTLEDLLTKLPESVAFDLEMKYPMLWETEDRGIDPIAIDVNLFVDTILDKIYSLAGNRNITFSSFSPEVCILLAHKQKDYPVLFISKAGFIPAGDVRASSMQHAIQFAKRWNLAGIVMLANPIVECPRLIGYAKRSGLVCASYGNLNDIPKNAKIQANAGLDAIIVNKVRLIAETLAN